MSPRGKRVTVEPESFVARWSRRKREAGGATRETDEPDKTHPGRDLEPHSTAVETAEELSDADMPPLASLGPDSDYSGFLSPGVSEELRRLALRKLFHSPIFNVTDGLDDYDDDFTSFGVLREAFHTRQHQAGDSGDAVPERSSETIEGSDSSDPDDTNEVMRTAETEAAAPSSSLPAGEDEVAAGTGHGTEAGASSAKDAPCHRAVSGPGSPALSEGRECDSGAEVRHG